MTMNNSSKELYKIKEYLKHGMAMSDQMKDHLLLFLYLYPYLLSTDVTGMEKELSFGEKAVGLKFNPSEDASVQKIKETFAAAIDVLNNLRDIAKGADNGEAVRMFSVAITEAQTAQMWGVKAVTWK